MQRYQIRIKYDPVDRWMYRLIALPAESVVVSGRDFYSKAAAMQEAQVRLNHLEFADWQTV